MSLGSSKAVVSPHVTCQCFFPSFGSHPRRGEVEPFLEIIPKCFPQQVHVVNTAIRRKLEGELALSLVLWLPLITGTEVLPLVLIDSLTFLIKYWKIILAQVFLIVIFFSLK